MVFERHIMVFGINYDEETQESYESIYLHYGTNKKKIFNSGDVIIDYIDMMIFSSDINETPLLGSSSYDNFLMDGNKYVGRVLEGSSIEFIVTDDIKTHEDLEKYYKAHKPK